MKAMILKALAGVSALALLAVLAFVTWVQLTYDRVYDVPYPDLQVSTDPDVIAHGEYLVRGPAHCGLCHGGAVEDSKRAETGEAIPLSGGWVLPIGPLGEVPSRNLTPDPETGIGRYEDKELFRMMRHNVRPNGQASLAPMMPFQTMADDDLVAVVSYLRSQEPVRNEIPESRWFFMGKVMRALAPPPFAPVVDQSWPEKAPPMEPTPERGEYLAKSVANCWACHSPLNPLTVQLEGPELSGSINPEVSPIDPTMTVRPPNLTPHPSGVLLKFEDEDAFVARFRTGRVYPASIMPWGHFSRLDENDIRALYRYLHTLPPVDHDVGPVVYPTP